MDSHADRLDLVRRLDEELIDELLSLAAKADCEDIRRLRAYAEDCAGAVTTADYTTRRRRTLPPARSLTPLG